MRLYHFLLTLAVANALASCTGTGVNSKDVYSKLSGTQKLVATVTDTANTPTTVTFTVDNNPIAGTVTAASGSFSISFDSTTVSNGIHTVKAVGQPGDVTLLDATIYVQNTTSTKAATATP